jgi:hypothetical protein
MHRSWRLLLLTAAGCTFVTMAGTARAQHTYQNNILFENGDNANVDAALPLDGRRLMDAFCNDEIASPDVNELLTNPYAPPTPFAVDNTGWVPKETSIAIGSRGCGVAAAANLIPRSLVREQPCDCTPRVCSDDYIFPECYRGAVPPASFLQPGEQQWYEGWINTGYGTSDVPPLPIKIIGPGSATDNSGDGTPWVWEAGFTYVLVGRCAVPAGETLTINAGVLVRGGSNMPPDFLVVEPGAKIMANGTKDAPIIMTSDQPSGQMGRGDWGGLVLAGLACANCADCTHGEQCASEGAPEEVFCGDQDDDNSGVVRYVRIEYAGYELSPDNELNSLTQNGLGCGTTIDHVQAHMGSDDCFEWFGGSVHDYFLVGTGNADDGLDWQMGFTGSAENCIIQYFDDAGDNGIEADNNEFDFNAPCRSNPIIANCTLIGRGPGVVAGGGNGALIRRGTDAQIANCLFLGWVGADRYGLNVVDAETGARGLYTAVDNIHCDSPAGVDQPEKIGSDLTVQTYPNPVTDHARFDFSLPHAGHVTMGVFDSNGRLIERILDSELTAGAHQVAWNVPGDRPSGTYFYRLEDGDRVNSGSFVAVR